VNRDAWWVFEESGMAICELGFWFLRWDLSPLGYLSTAAHGHLDALHLSMWFKGVALVIDPGTGAYYADSPLRTWLASRAAHNGPCPAGEEFPKRLGPFLWAEPHDRPRIVRGRTEAGEAAGLFGELRLPSGLVVRNFTRVAAAAGDGWEVSDQFEPGPGGPREFSVRWQFAPGTFVKMLAERRWAVKRGDVSIVIEAGPEWAAVRLVETKDQQGAPRHRLPGGAGVPPATVPASVPLAVPFDNRDGCRDGGSRDGLPHFGVAVLQRAQPRPFPHGALVSQLVLA
jgi:hypothetical protein